jgi:hypothetical protein
MSTTSIAPEAPVAGAAAAARVAAPRERAVRWALARFEARRLLLHPLFLAGIVGSVAFLVTATGGQSLDVLAGYGFTFIGLAIWTSIAAGLAVGREQRDAAQDFYAGQPVSPRTRTQAALLSLGAAGLVAATMIAVATVVRTGVDGVLVAKGESYTLHPLELAQGPVYVVMAGALGVFVVTWARRTWAAVIVALVLFLPPLAWLPWFVFGDGVPASFDLDWLTGASVGWHLTGLVGLTTLAAAGALARHDRRPWVGLLALAGLAATVAGLVLGMPNPPPGA